MRPGIKQRAFSGARRFAQPAHGGRTAWALYALVLIAAPLVFHKGASLSVLSQMGTAMLFGLSYNMLLGQGGMLSFGHAVYSGLGAFFAIHAMNLAAAGAMPVPVTLIPLIGGMAGMGFGVLFGYLSTRKAGTAFSMITLGIVELVFASALMFPGFFGGEGGVAADRVIGEPVLGISYGPQIQVYYLIAFWLFVCTAAMYAWTHTPLGRIMNAVRDNPERAAFIGYDPRRVRHLTLMLSAFFAGVSGGLSAVNFEIATAENVSVLRSGAVLLFTYIGGIGFFFGPLIGAAVGIFMTVLLPEFTLAWQLYLGLLFIFIVTAAPEGIAGIAVRLLRMAQSQKLRALGPAMLAAAVSAFAALLGFALLIELIYQHAQDADAPKQAWFGFALDAGAPGGWGIAAVLLAAGGLALRHAQPAFMRAWSRAEAEIEAEAEAETEAETEALARTEQT